MEVEADWLHADYEQQHNDTQSLVWACDTDLLVLLVQTFLFTHANVLLIEFSS